MSDETTENRPSMFNTLGYKLYSKGATSWLSKRTLTEALFVEMAKDERDWEFVLKFAALTEAFVCDFLLHVLPPDDLAQYQDAGIEVRTKKYSMMVHEESTLGQKIALCDTRSMFPPEEITWFGAITALRNEYAHRIENLDLPMWQLLQRLPEHKGLDIYDGLWWNSMDADERRRELSSLRQDARILNRLTRRELPRMQRDFTPKQTLRMARGTPAELDKMMQAELRHYMLAHLHGLVGRFEKQRQSVP